MTEEIIKIIKDAEKQRHNNHINAGKMNWKKVRLEVFDKIDEEIKRFFDKEMANPKIRDFVCKYVEIKDSHLSTFPEKEKRHNSSFIQDCYDKECIWWMPNNTCSTDKGGCNLPKRSPK